MDNILYLQVCTEMIYGMLALALLGIKLDKELETAECTTEIGTAATENLQ